MNYLGDILIIDDEVEEAYNLSELFAKMECIPIILKPEHISSDLMMLPKIVCCDINLHGTDDTQNFKTIAGLLKKIYTNDKKGLYIFVAWTSHKDKLDALKNYIKADADVHQPLDFLAMGKDEYINNPQKLKTKIDSIFKNNQGLKACLLWNNIIREANDETIASLSNLASKTQVDLLALLDGLANANFGKKKIKDETTAIIKPISYILRDNIERKLICSPHQKQLKRILKKIPNNSNLSDIVKSNTNSILHISSNVTHNKMIPGDVIKISDKELKSVFRKEVSLELKTDIIKKGESVNSIEFALLEITPDCDYSNVKTHNVNKFALTYLIPSGKESKLDNEYYKRTKIKIIYKEMEYMFVVDCRYIFSIIPKKNFIKNRIFSLRENLFTSFRQQIYSYNSRIGTISF